MLSVQIDTDQICHPVVPSCIPITSNAYSEQINARTNITAVAANNYERNQVNARAKQVDTIAISTP